MPSLAELAKLLCIGPDRLVSIPSGGGGLRMFKLDVDPYEFLLLAEQDWERGGLAAELNAVTNAKRAIVAQMDQALLSFGFPAMSWNVPKKLEALNSLGLIAPRILRRVSANRNLLEHEYRRPAEPDIEDAIDLAALFIASIRPLISLFPDEFIVGHEDEQIDHFVFKRDFVFSMTGSKAEDGARFRVCARRDQMQVGETIVTCKDREFAPIVRLAIATDRGFKAEAALADFRSLLVP